MTENLRIEKGEIYQITVADDVVSSAVVWNTFDNAQDTLNGNLAAGSSLYLGPYLNITTFRIETVGTVTVAKMGDDFSTPVSPFLTRPIVLGDAATVTLTEDTPVAVEDTRVTANSVILFTVKTVGGTQGAYPVATPTAGTGFDVVGDAGDTSVYNYVIVDNVT